jgi:hypothetical protein
MRVFISWSGARSKAIAEILRQWLPGVIQAVKPYYSPDDISKGARWSSEIGKELEAARVGLICLTRDNRNAPWIMFEAGALSKNLDKSKVCPVLFGIEPSEISGPLVQFQASAFSKAEMERVMRMINTELGDAALASDVLDSVFEMWWPKLEERVAQEMAKPDETQPTTRSERDLLEGDLLEEVLELSRSLARDRRAPIASAAVTDLMERYAALVDAVESSSDSDDVARAIRHLSMPLGYILRRVAPESDAGMQLERSIRRMRPHRRPSSRVAPSEEPVPGDVLLEEADDPVR